MISKVEPIEFFFIVAALWVLSGLLASYFMGRRGHNPFGWWFLGAVFGPLVLVLAVDAVRRRTSTSELVGEPGFPGRGPVDVLVGTDGSAEAEAALQAVCRMLGSRLGRLTVATVVSYEAAERDGEDRAEAEEVLRRALASVTVCRPETIILVGQPALVLAEYAQERYYDLLAVGSRGRGVSKAILGSTASQLVRQARVPVLVAGSASRMYAPSRQAARRTESG